MENIDILMKEVGIYVTAADIEKIGNTLSKNDRGFLEVICDTETANIEEIFLRNILRCFGEEYVIVDKEDFVWTLPDGSEKTDIRFKTNLPGELVF